MYSSHTKKGITIGILILAACSYITLRLSLWFRNGRLTRPLLFLHSYLFKSANAKTSGFNRFVNITDDVSQPAMSSAYRNAYLCTGKLQFPIIDNSILIGKKIRSCIIPAVSRHLRFPCITRRIFPVFL